MKRFVQLTVLMLAASLLAMSASAQTPIKFGFKGGFNLATVTGDDTDDYETRSGFIGGVFTRLSLRGPIGIQAELLLATKGAKQTFDRTVIVGTDTSTAVVDKILKADYFEIPVLLRYSLKGKGPAGLNLYGGPVFAFGRSSRTTDVMGLGDDIDNYNEKSTDLGLAVGAGLDLKLASYMLVLDVRYTLGMQDMWEDVVVADIPGDVDQEAVYADAVSGEAFKMKNSAISITAGFMF
jgi:opacity protein-like surface antigen